MTSLVLEPTSTALWQALVSDAEAAANRQLDETLESYLVLTLMRFTQRPELVSSVMALEFLDSAQKAGQQQHAQLRDVGDKCLLVSGLFPQNAKRRLVSIGYFVNMGRSAYQQLHDKIHGFYGQLAADFIPMMDVLHAMRELNDQSQHIDLLDAFELWEETGSQHALERVKDGSSGGHMIKRDWIDGADTSH
ncbi:hypothetical protein Tel_02440 [Candidatus Tenderia electrophaga]|jgi:hypothetical protein|uniref:Uncharacterized protein n=1 Tax=Candidatus Tenderia electrophaga TaxID=1748243 RepID=A0A0S2TAC4_9GAMM|nr:hypothetical protein Tel_02440 [Candidatus Tenderia electrophaga]